MQLPVLLTLVALTSFTTLIMLLFNAKKKIFAMLSSILWIVCGAGATVIQRPFHYVVENIDNLGTYIEKTGTQNITANTPLWTLFIGLAFFCLFYLFVLSWEDIKDWLSRRTSGYGKGGY